MLLLTAAVSLALVSLASAQFACSAQVIQQNNVVEVTATLNGNPVNGMVSYSLNGGASDSQSVPPPITIPVSSLNLGTNSISLSHQSGLQTFTCTVGVAIQSLGIQCEVEFNSTIVKLNCLENGEEFSGPSASYSINDRPSFNIPGFPVYIERSQFTQSSNELSVTLETSAGTTAMQAFIISGFQTGPTVTFQVGCGVQSQGSLSRISCTEVTNSESIDSFVYTVNGVPGTTTAFPIVIDRDLLDIGVNNVSITLTSGSGRTLVANIQLTRTQAFDVSCNRNTNSNEELDIGCTVNSGNSQTIESVRRIINGIEREPITVTNPRALDYSISFDSDLLVRGDENNITLIFRGSGGTEAVFTTIISIPLPPFSVSCSYMFVENGAFLEVVCVSTGSQDISSIEYTVNGLQTRTVVGSSFRVAGSEFNLENNRIELRITGDQGTIAPPLTALPLTLGNIIQPVSCSSVLDQATNEIVITCRSGGVLVQASYEYRIEGQTVIERGTTGPGAPIRIDLTGVAGGQNIILTLRRGDGSILAQQRITLVSFQVSCSGMYVNDGSLAISCTSPQEITSIEYMLNGGSSVTVGGSSFVIPSSELSMTSVNTVNLRVSGASQTVDLQNLEFPQPIFCNFSFVNGDVIISCQGGISAVVRYEYTINEQVRGGSTQPIQFPLTISSSKLSQGNNTVVLTLYGANNRILSRTTFTSTTTTTTERFGFSCEGNYIGDSSGGLGVIQITCAPQPNNTENIGYLRYSLNGGADVRVDTLSFTITENLSSDSNRVDIIAVGARTGTESTISLPLPAPIICDYTLDNGLIVFSCSGGTLQVVRYQYRINDGAIIEGSGFPINIDITSPDLLPPPQMNTIVFTFFSSSARILGETTFRFPLPQPAPRCEHNGVMYEVGDTFPAGDGCNTCSCIGSGGSAIVACTLIACPGPLTVECGRSAVPGRATIDCIPSNPAVDITCLFDGVDSRPCEFPLGFNFGDFGFIPHTVNVTVTDIFSQTVDLFFRFRLARPLGRPPVTIDFTNVTSVLEGAVESPFRFQIRGSTLEPFTFSLVPLTYQEFETINGQSVETIFGPFTPPPAGRDNILSSGKFDFTYEGHEGIFPISVQNLTYDLVSAVSDDDEAGPNEGFILYIDIDENNNPSDNFDVEVGSRAILVTIVEDDLPPLPLGLPLEFSVEEDSTGSRLGLGLIGHSEGVVQFTVTPMTYQQFETATGTLVSSLPLPPGAIIPPPAGLVDISSNAAQTYTFGPNPPTNPRLAADFVFDVALAVIDDSIGEGDEGFILLLELDESNIDVVTITNGVTLVTIRDNDYVVSIGVPQELSVAEDSTESFMFGASGHSREIVRFSLTPLTYQQFETITNTEVVSVFPPGTIIPPAASEDDISSGAEVTLTFGPNPLTNPQVFADYVFDLAAAVVDDLNVEGDEGFILLLQLDDSNNPSDTVLVTNAATLVTISDNDGPRPPLVLDCEEIQHEFFGGVRCTHTGGIGRITFTCSYDNEPIESCNNPVVLNRIRFSAETHTLQINATDSVGSVGTFIYTFVGERPPDLKLIVSPKYVVVEEDGRSSANIVVTKEGYSFGEVQFTLVPLTYSQFESEIGKNLDLLFPFRPIPPAFTSDFNTQERSSFFEAGLVPQGGFLVSGNGLALPDSEAEFTEGFVFYLKVNKSSLHKDDRDRLQIVNQVVLVSIKNNNLPLECTLTGNGIDEPVTVSCDGSLPSNVDSSSVECRLDDDIIVDCSQFPTIINAITSGTGRHTVIISGSTFTGDILAVGEATFTIPEIDLTFIDDTPLLLGHTVYAEFSADRPGLEFYCHLTHLDPPTFREDCSNGTYRRDDLTVGDFTLRVIAYDPLRGDMAVIRARLWVHSTDLNDLFCIMYLKNRGWGVSGTTFSVDFTGTGMASAANGGGFECSVDRKPPETCTSPLVLTDLDPGRTYHMRIRPTRCGRDYRVWSKRFTVPRL